MYLSKPLKAFQIDATPITFTRTSHIPLLGHLTCCHVHICSCRCSQFKWEGKDCVLSFRGVSTLSPLYSICEYSLAERTEGKKAGGKNEQSTHKDTLSGWCTLLIRMQLPWHRLLWPPAAVNYRALTQSLLLLSYLNTFTCQCFIIIGTCIIIPHPQRPWPFTSARITSILHPQVQTLTYFESQPLAIRFLPSTIHLFSWCLAFPCQLSWSGTLYTYKALRTSSVHCSLSRERPANSSWHWGPGLVSWGLQPWLSANVGLMPALTRSQWTCSRVESTA